MVNEPLQSPQGVTYDALAPRLDARARAILERRREITKPRRRGWVIRRALLVADLLALTIAYSIPLLLFGGGAGPANHFETAGEYILFLAMLPLWVVVAKLYGLYDRDEERTDHSTGDELVGVFHVVTVGAWLVLAGAWLTSLAEPQFGKLVTFWLLAIALVTAGRASARALCRKSISYLQNTVIVGAGDVGQLVARKFLQHPEYGINLVGFVDSDPKGLRDDLSHVAVVGSPQQLPEIVRALDVERVVIAFSGARHEETVSLMRSLKKLDLQLDIVPRLFDVIGPKFDVHAVEGLPLVGLPPAKLSRSSALIKRTVDIVGALLGLVLTSPLFAYIAWRIKRDSPGPVLFRQQRLGFEMKEFTALKFRTMRVDTDDSPHRAFIKSTMTSSALPGSNGLYKLEREDAVTPFGRWLRRTSLDELPQLINVLRGEMSLVGPRPCIPYEVEHFAPHHFERFLVPAGVTGLWQVTARAHATFGEALDLDVAYARDWSLGLDLRLLFRTPLQLLRGWGTA